MIGGGNLGLGGLDGLPWLLLVTCTLVVGIPLTIWVIRILNETVFDPYTEQREQEDMRQAPRPVERPTRPSEAIRQDNGKR